MENKELQVIKIAKGIGSMKWAYIVKHEDKEVRVPMFNFQKKKDCPQKIRCRIENGRIVQNPQIIIDTFYTDSDTYLFRIKARRDMQKYYILEDERLKEESWHITLPFSESNPNMKVGYYIKCKIKGIENGKLYLTLADGSPSLIAFKSIGDIFYDSMDGVLTRWIEFIMEKDFMAATKSVYDDNDGKWICLFAKELERIVYLFLTSDLQHKEDLLYSFCKSWIAMVEHSSLMNNLSEKETEDFSKALTLSIEICEDCLDAISLPDKEKKIKEIILSLNPLFYQYRIERKFRFMACIFLIDRDILKNNITSFLEKVRELGEDECCSERIYMPLSSILMHYTDIATENLVNLLSMPSYGTVNIKQGILALCYLIRIMDKNKHPDTRLYISRIFILVTLYNSTLKEKLLSLKNAYSCIFSNTNIVNQFKWDDLGNIVKSKIYLFSIDEIPAECNMEYICRNGSSHCILSHNGISLSPESYKGDLAVFKMKNGLSTWLSYGKSIQKAETERNFLEVRNLWRDITASVFTRIQKVGTKKGCLCNGEQTDIYVTEIIDNTSARCKAIGYDEEGILRFNDFFFYDKPGVSIHDFEGTDGAPLIFPAVCRISNEEITFDSKQYKANFVLDEIGSEGDTVLCKVIYQKVHNRYTCVTEKGLMLSVYSTYTTLDLYTFIDVIITKKYTDSGFIQASFEGYSDERFEDNVYANYIRLFNSYNYGEETTLKDLKQENSTSVSQNTDVYDASPELIKCVVTILNKLSCLEPKLQIRYGYLSICRMLIHLIDDQHWRDIYFIRMKFTEYMYSFSLNNTLSDMDVIDFQHITEKWKYMPEIREKLNILQILSKLGKNLTDAELDKKLITYLSQPSSPLEKELAKLVLSSNLLSDFNSMTLQEKILDEIGKIVNIEIIKPETIHIGEENQTTEFKTSIVFPPDSHGNADPEQQSDNIIKVILAMMNARGGTLYVGVNDSGNVVGLYNDLVFFSKEGTYDEFKAKDNFNNYFSHLLSERLGAENAAKINYDFMPIENYTIFKVDIPVIHDENNNWIRVGSTVQKK